MDCYDYYCQKNTETIKYQKIPINTMNEQINIRLPENILAKVRLHIGKYGYANIQEFIRETIREKLFPAETLTKSEAELVKKILLISKKKNLYGTEDELFKLLKK